MRVLLEQVAAGLGRPMAELTQSTALSRTDVLQPVLTALNLGVYLELMNQGLRARCVAGHSLGELAACAAAGAMRPEAAVAVAITRGRLMAREAALHPGGMLAIRSRREEFDGLFDSPAGGMVSVAARNSPEEWVVSGDMDSLRAFSALGNGTPVATPGPWHSPSMADAVTEYEAALRQATSDTLRIPLICNRTGNAITDVRLVPELLAGQLISPVEWWRSMLSLALYGVDHVVICGPGKSLRRFARSALPGAAIDTVATPEDLIRLRSLAAH